jgi:hypothetical protein
MAPAERLARLSAEFAGFDAIFGGKAALTRSDLAAACAGISRLGFAIVMAKYVGDDDSTRKIIQGAEQSIHRHNLLADPDLAHQVASLAVLEFLGGDLCPACGGRGSVYPRGAAARSCKVCEGRGRAVPGQRRRAKLAGMPVQAWRDSGADQATKRIRNILEREEATALVIFFQRMRD